MQKTGRETRSGARKRWVGRRGRRRRRSGRGGFVFAGIGAVFT
jgi:hypothetical protein